MHIQVNKQTPVTTANQNSKLPTKVFGFAYQSFKSIDAHAEGFRKNITLSSDLGGRLDVHTWLARASESYQISANISDYVLVPTSVIISEIPNTNGVAFSLQELTKFRPSFGAMAFSTFKGKPCYVEHQNSDYAKASGVVFDVFLRPLTDYGFNLAKVVTLLGFDRSKNTIADDILNKKRNAYSMGAEFEYFTMSDGSHPTQAKWDTPLYKNANNDLVYCLPHNLTGFEVSSVAKPAWTSAVGENILTF